MSLAITLHVLAAVVWVGGMFFAHQVLRPIVATQLEPPARLRLWTGVFNRFFLWVWLAVVLLPLSGYWAIFAVLGGMGSVGLRVHIMSGIGLLMIALYLFLYFVPFQRLKAAVAAEEWPTGAAQLNTIRRIVGTNLILGLVAVVVAAGGRYFY